MVGAAKAAGLFFATLMGLSPVLKTLTEDTSSDTVWAFVCILFLVNMLFHDYSSYRPSDMGRSASAPTRWIFPTPLLTRVGPAGFGAVPVCPPAFPARSR